IKEWARGRGQSVLGGLARLEKEARLCDNRVPLRNVFCRVLRNRASLTNSHLSAKRGSSSNKRKGSYCHEKSCDLFSGLGLCCPSVSLYADEGSKPSVSISGLSISGISTRDRTVANIACTSCS